MGLSKTTVSTLTAFACGLHGAVTHAQTASTDYPVKLVRLVIPFAVGGSGDASRTSSASKFIAPSRRRCLCCMSEKAWRCRRSSRYFCCLAQDAGITAPGSLALPRILGICL